MARFSVTLILRKKSFKQSIDTNKSFQTADKKANHNTMNQRIKNRLVISKNYLDYYRNNLSIYYTNLLTILSTSLQNILFKFLLIVLLISNKLEKRTTKKNSKTKKLKLRCFRLKITS